MFFLQMVACVYLVGEGRIVVKVCFKDQVKKKEKKNINYEIK